MSRRASSTPGSWDGLGADNGTFLRGWPSATRPAVGAPDDLIRAVLYAMGSPYVTGTVLHVDGSR